MYIYFFNSAWLYAYVTFTNASPSMSPNLDL